MKIKYVMFLGKKRFVITFLSKEAKEKYDKMINDENYAPYPPRSWL